MACYRGKMVRTLDLRLLLAISLVAHVGVADANPLDFLREREGIGLHKIPNSGTSHVLVIPSRINATAFPATRLAAMKKFYAKDGGPGTFREYWQIVSNGTYDPIPTLVDPVLYSTTCPIPGKPLNSCTFELTDIELIATGGARTTFEDILGRVRDEQGIDFGDFDVNGKDGQPDGFIDAVIVDTNAYSGIAFPLAALENVVTLGATSAADPNTITIGIVALVEPDLHEYAHLFGFMDLYSGPTVNGLMADLRDSDGVPTAALSAFSRQQIGWGETVMADGAGEHTLKPVLDGGTMLRVGTDKQYLLIENRGGDKHDTVEHVPKGINIYSVDESILPTVELGFLNITEQNIRLLNKKTPYVNINLPVECDLMETGTDNSCVLDEVGQTRALIHEAGMDTKLTLRVVSVESDGSIKIELIGEEEPDDKTTMTGCSVSGVNEFGLLCLLLLALRRRFR